MDINSVIEGILQKIRPTEGERAFLNELMRELEDLSKETIEELGLNANPHFVGSLAKDTYLAGDHDVDLFLAFPLETPLEELRERGLELGKAIAKKLDSHEVAYAEHPYVRATYRGVKVDLVPCYNVKGWKDVKTAVDRSILHTKWVNEHLNGRNDEVRLLKRFLKGINAYGSEIYVRGFSGYLAEILIIKYGSFLEVVKNADLMLKQRVIDPEGWLRKEPESAMKTIKRETEGDKPLIVIDPVDPRRNVSANLSWERYGVFYFGSMNFLEEPSINFFFPRRSNNGDYRLELRRKGSHILTLIFNKPNLVDDLLLPQLERSARGIEKVLERENFRVFGWDVGYARDWAFIMLELDRLEREKVTIKEGPEFFTRNGLDFYRKNERVWIKGKRLYAEKTIEENVMNVLIGLIGRDQISLGKSITDSVRNTDVLVDYVPKELEQRAYLFLSKEEWNLKKQQ
ncbi:CCA tRNA nucleotidyltransferase [Thermococcus sp.]|uniref:CCA tRNA nucleotidyltransferase n=1 Tax=Thermococcus sp. TaxID=35749 RepID=UPI002633E09D|nr:CCA tRNA nucleotidyltransferase [Thermococcus sp.]